MFQVYNCLTAQHDWRLVGVAAVICLFASLTAVNIFNRARATGGRTRAIWIIAAGVAGGFGIWATHFVAMLAYEPGITVAYGVTLTVFSLAAAAATMSFALSIAVYVQARWAAPLSGELIGGRIAAMHYLRRVCHGCCDPLIQEARRGDCSRAADAGDCIAPFHRHGRSRDRP